MKRLHGLLLILLGVILIFNACEKEAESIKNYGVLEETNEMQMRMALQEDGYTEVEVEPIVKIDCYFENWDKTIMTPVSGLLEYYDSSDNWVASLNFGDGSCDEWVTKTWDVNLFPEYPAGSEDFSLFQ